MAIAVSMTTTETKSLLAYSDSYQVRLLLLAYLKFSVAPTETQPTDRACMIAMISIADDEQGKAAASCLS